MKIPLSFGNYLGHSGAQNAQVLQNMMLERDEQGGKEPYFSFLRPGLKAWADTGTFAEVRGLFNVGGDKVLAVVGDTLFGINRATRAVTTIGTILTASGPVDMEDNPTQVMLVDGQYGYVYEKGPATLAQITDLDFPGAASLTYQNGYGIICVPETGRFYLSGINDFTVWDALDFATAEAAPDNAVAVLADHEDLLVFGEKTIEPYVDTGNVDFPYERRSGAMLEIGCGAGHSPAKGENIFFWLDDHGIARKAEGYSPIIISTRQTEHQTNQLPSFSDGRGMFAVIGGHPLYILTFPAGDYTLVYDVSVQQWYRWTSYPSDSRWRGNCLMQDGKLILVGDYENGIIYEPDEATEAAQGTDPQIVMTYSDNGGKTWSNEKWRSAGKVGEYSAQPAWNRLGRSRNRLYRFEGTDAVRKDNGERIHWVVTANEVHSERKWTIHRRLELDIEAGVGNPVLLSAILHGEVANV